MQQPAITEKFPSRLFVTGTDTNVGKTFVSAVLVAGLKAAYWKPVQSGSEEGTDREAVKNLSGLPDAHFLPESYCFTRPLSPDQAAGLEGARIDSDLINIPEAAAEFNHLIIEGAGGIMVPLNEQFLMLDLMKKLATPVLVVARSGLGTINHTVLTVDKLRREGLTVFGVIMNGPRNPANKAAIERHAETKVIAETEPLETLNPTVIKSLFLENFAGTVRV
jgi:dethiobiotin synthase